MKRIVGVILATAMFCGSMVLVNSGLSANDGSKTEVEKDAEARAEAEKRAIEARKKPAKKAKRSKRKGRRAKRKPRKKGRK